MEDRDKKTELLVGLFLFVGLLLLGGLILQFGRVKEAFKDTYQLRVAFPNAAGIKEGSPVYLGGSRVGKVKGLPQLNDTFSGVIIALEIFDNVEIPLNAEISIGSAGLMGDALVEIKPAGKETKEFIPHDYGGVIEGAKKGGLSELQNSAVEVSKKVDVVLDDVRAAVAELKGALSKVNNDALSPETLNHFKESMEHLNSTMTRIDDKVLGDENAQNLKTALAELKEAATSFKSSAKNIEEQTKRLGPMFDKLDPAIEKADRVMTTADESLKSIKTAADNFATAARNITTGKGLLGALMNDPELKTDFKDLIGNLKRNGVIFYRDSADKEREKADGEESRASRNVPPLFGR